MKSTQQHQRVILLWLAIVFCSLEAIAQVLAPCASIEKRLDELLKAQEEMRSEPSANVRLSPQQLKLRAKLEEEIKQQYAALAVCREKNPTTPAKASGTGNAGNQAPAPTRQGASPSSPGTFSGSDEYFAYKDAYPDNFFPKDSQAYREEERRRKQEWFEKHPNWELEQAKKRKLDQERADDRLIVKWEKERQERNAKDPNYAKRKAEADAKLKQINQTENSDRGTAIFGVWRGTPKQYSHILNRSESFEFNEDGTGVFTTSCQWKDGGGWSHKRDIKYQSVGKNQWKAFFGEAITISGSGRNGGATERAFKKGAMFTLSDGVLLVDLSSDWNVRCTKE